MTSLIHKMGLLYVIYIAVFVINVHASTDPTSIVCTALNSTGLQLTWTSATDVSVLGYYLDVERVDGLKIEPAVPTTDLSDRNYATHDTHGLGKYGTYDITLFSYTSSTNNTQYVTTCTTSEDVPDNAPYNFACTSYSISAIQCSWNALEQVYWNGILQGYKLQWLTTVNVSQLYTTTVDNSTTTLLVTSLRYATMYTLLLNAYTNVGDSTVYITTTGATKGIKEEVEDNTTRYYCNEAVPGMIEFGWEEMPCTIYSGTIGALLIVCTLFIAIFACQACCKGKTGTNNLELNVFNSHPVSRGRKFQDDDTDTDQDDDDDDDIPHIREKRPIDDDDEYGGSEVDEEVDHDNKGFSPDQEHEYDDRYTATPDDVRNTATPDDDRHTATSGNDRNTATPGNGAKSSMSTAADPPEEASDNRAKPKPVQRKRIITARDVELRNIDEEDHEHSDVFSDSDYDSQSDNDFIDDSGPHTNKSDVASKVLPGAVAKQTISNSKQQNRNEEILQNTAHKKSKPTPKQNGKDAKGSNMTKGQTSDKTKTIVDVHTTEKSGKEQIQVHGENVVQKNVPTKGMKSNDTNTSNPPRTYSAGNVENVDDIHESEWGSPAFGTGVKQTYNTPKMTQNGLIATTKAQNMTPAHATWDEDDEWGDSSQQTNQIPHTSSQTMSPIKKTDQVHNRMKNNKMTTCFNSMDVSENGTISGWNSPSGFHKKGFGNNQTLGHNNSAVYSEANGIQKNFPTTVIESYEVGESIESSGWDTPSTLTKLNSIDTRSVNHNSMGLSESKKMPKTHPSVFQTTEVNESSESAGWNKPTVANQRKVANNTISGKDNVLETEDTDDWGVPVDTKTVIPNNKSFFGKQTVTSAALNNNSNRKAGNKSNKSNKTFNIINETSSAQSHQNESSNVLIEYDDWTDNNTEAIMSDRSTKANHIKGRIPNTKAKFNNSKGEHDNNVTTKLNAKPFSDTNNRHKNDATGNVVGTDKNVRGVNKNYVKQTVSPSQQKNGNDSLRDQQKPQTSTTEYKNIFYIQDEIENVPFNADANEMSDMKRPKSEQNGKMIRTNAWQPQNHRQSMPSGRKTPVKSIPKSQSWTTLEPEPVIGTDRLSKKFPFLNASASDNPKTVKKVSSETDVKTYDSTLSELRRSSEPVKKDSMKQAMVAFTDQPKKSDKSNLNYGFGVHRRFSQIAAAMVSKFRAKKNPVKTVNSEWF